LAHEHPSNARPTSSRLSGRFTLWAQLSKGYQQSTSDLFSRPTLASQGTPALSSFTQWQTATVCRRSFWLHKSHGPDLDVSLTATISFVLIRTRTCFQHGVAVVRHGFTLRHRDTKTTVLMVTDFGIYAAKL
jgi:hypothetical protein